MFDPINKVGAFTSFDGILKHVIVGDMIDSSYFNHVDTPGIEVVKQICYESKQDLDKLANIYVSHGVTVERPAIQSKKPSIELIAGTNVINPAPPKTPHDHVLCIDNIFVNTFSTIERFQDKKSIQHIVDRLSNNIKYLEVPTPTFWDYDYYDQLTNELWPGNNDILCDGPCFYPCGNTVFFTQQETNSERGVNFIKDIFQKLSFVQLNLPIKNHLDGQFRIIKPGHLISVHPKQVLVEQFPKFKSWDITQDNSYQTNKSLFLKNLNAIKDWIDTDINNQSCDLGFVHINSNLVIINNTNKNLCKALDRAKVDWIDAQLRHSIFWNSSVSCATAIIHREDECIDYFN